MSCFKWVTCFRQHALKQWFSKSLNKIRKVCKKENERFVVCIAINVDTPSFRITKNTPLELIVCHPAPFGALALHEGDWMSAMPINKFSHDMTQMAPPSLLFTACPSQILKKSPSAMSGIALILGWHRVLGASLAASLAAVGTDSWSYFGKVASSMWGGGVLTPKAPFVPRNKGTVVPFTHQHPREWGKAVSQCESACRTETFVCHWMGFLFFFYTKKNCVVEPQIIFSVSKIGGKRVVV